MRSERVRTELRSTSRFAFLAVSIAAALLVSTSAVALQAEDEETVTIEEEHVRTHAPARYPDDHDPLRAAHPLRIVAYTLHPVGVALDWIVVRPAVWAARHEPLRTIFGYQD
jgi:hypothetical protein